MYERPPQQSGHLGGATYGQHSATPPAETAPSEWPAHHRPRPAGADPPKVSRHDERHTTPRNQAPAGVQHAYAYAPFEAAPPGAPPPSSQHPALRALAESAELAAAAGLPTPRRICTAAASAPSPQGCTGLTPMAAQLQLGSPGSAAPFRPPPQAQAQHQPRRLDVAPAAGGAPAAQPWVAPPYQPPGSVPAPPGTGSKAKAPVRHHSTVDADADGDGDADADAIKAVHQAAPPAPPYHRSSWPIIPGVPVVEGPRRAPPPAPQHARATAAPAAPPPPPLPAHGYALRSAAHRAAPPPPPPPPAPARGPPPRVEATPPPPAPAPSPRRGMSAAAALRTLGHVMTLYERAEILQYHEIFFAGRSGAAKIRGSALSCEPNHGFDDARGEYLPVAGDHVAYRYEVQSVLGRGSFGQVLRCVDHATGGAVALKIIRNKRRFQRQAVVEAGILGALARRDPDGAWGAVRMLDSFTFRCHLCITFELLSINLYELIKSNNFVGCSPDLVRRVARQVLRTLSHLRRLDLVHCDLKPENILLVARGSSEVRVIDFGSSCYSDQRVFTYIQSRFYRAPEVILGCPYGAPIDIWSLGCVLAELATGRPLLPGEDEAEQLACITEMLGLPHPSLLAGAARGSMFFDMVTGTPHPVPPNSHGRIHRPGALTLEAALGGVGDWLFLDFLRGCLQWDPALRFTPEQALRHEWLADAAHRVPTPPGAPGGPLLGGSPSAGGARCLQG